MILTILVLTCNIFLFNGVYYFQLIGVAMGTRLAPTFACLFMGVLESKFLASWTGLAPRMWRRYIDDIFFLWNEGEEELKLFLSHLNESHPTIKFTATYDFATRAVPFLDTVVSIGADGYIKTNLYIKPGTKCTYLAPTSSHPNFIAKNIPFSLAYRLLRICSDPRDLTLSPTT